MAEAACMAHGNGVYLALPSQKGRIVLKSSKRLFSNTILIAFIVFSAVMYGQTGASDSTPAQAADVAQNVPSVKVTTRLVIVDVVAHDKKGHAITDLEAADLRILEDGKEQPIGSFIFQRGFQPVETAAQEAAALPANMVSNARKYPPNTALNVILLDSLNSNLLNQAYVRTEMVKFLEKLPQGQPVAIFTLGRKLHIVQDFTTDLTALKRVIAEFKGEAPLLTQNPAGTSEVSIAPQGLAAQALTGAHQDLIEGDPLMLMQMKDFAEQTTSDQNDVRIQYTFAALTSLGRMLSRYKGRKNLIWVSESIPMNIFATVDSHNPVDSFAGKVPEKNTGNNPNRRYEDQLAYLGSLLADAQVAVYPIDARGLIGSPLYNVASNLSGQGGSSLGGLAMKAEGKQSEELFQSHVAMLDLADKTGGKAYYNRNDIDTALSDGIDDGSTYYMVGYYPQNKKWDGRFRRIEVKTRRHGINLRYRTGYFAIDRAAYLAKHPEQTDIEFSQALNLEAPMASALQFKAEVNPPAADSSSSPAANSKTVLLRYEIDPAEIQFTSGADGLQHAQVNCAVRAFAPKDLDKPVKTEGTKVNAALKPDALAKIKSSFFPCELKIDLPPGQYLLRLAVRDGNSGIVGSANAQVAVPAQPVAQR
ncbi:MAG TPA: VWA domain-containing protein [Candidatus Angelobacter sp.]|jgi:VWFA-related protein